MKKEITSFIEKKLSTMVLQLQIESKSKLESTR